MKKILLLGIILLSVLFLSAQHLQIEKERSQLFITHTVTAKETLYSLGRMYDLSPKEIAAANKLKTDAGIQIGQHIKIPLKKSNFVQAAFKTKKGMQPVYHTIKKGDNLSKLSKRYNKVKEAQLKKWNNLSKNTIRPGQEIIVGYVKINSNGPSVNKDEAVASKAKTKPDSSKTIAKAPAKEVPAFIPDPIAASAQQEQSSGKMVTNANTKTETGAQAVTVANTLSGEGYFSGDYSINAANAQEKKLNGTAATFKSTSGWSDKKYYILINEVAPETIVKITANGRSVYAKVLEALPDLKDNKNLICRLSNAAASVLGITDAKFDVEIVFYE
jgi:LysM repeat protein